MFAICTACHGAQAEGNQDAQRAEARGSGRLVHRAAAAELQARRARRATTATLSASRWRRFASMLDRRRGVSNVVAYIALAARHARADASVERQSSSAARSCTRPAQRATATRARASGRTNAPRLAGMSDWYLARQLENFRQGIRGTHPQDFHGAQMALAWRGLAQGRAVDRRPARLYQHALIDEELAIRHWRFVADRCVRRDRDRTPSARSRRRSSRSTSGARTTRSSRSSTRCVAIGVGLVALVLSRADAAAARLPRHVPLHHAAATITSSSPCTA